MNASVHRSPALILLINGGRKVPVCGANLQVALWAAALADAVLRRGEEIPLPTSRDGGLVRVQVNEQTLVQFLLDVYAEEPATVAEAVMALRKLDRGRAAWLLRVLRTTPATAALARAVFVELTGEEPPADFHK
jgi:hypothetical protein